MGLPARWAVFPSPGRVSGKESQAASSIGRSRLRTSGSKRPSKRKVRGGGSACGDERSTDASDDYLVVSPLVPRTLQHPGLQTCPPSGRRGTFKSRERLHHISLPPADSFLYVSRETA